MALKSVITTLVLSVLVTAAPPPLFHRNAKIVGGDEALPNEFPSVVSVQLNGERWCGGTLLNGDTVLTAAHCVEYDPINYTIRAGSNIWNEGGKLLKVSEHFQHPAHNSSTKDADLAIIKLAETIEESESISYITLPQPHTDPVSGINATAAGWGDLKLGSPAGKEMRKVTAPIIGRERCNELNNGLVNNNMICMGLEEGGKDTCTGDSGGPLYDPSNVQIGIVSWGIGCGTAGRPGVYVRVANFLDFINKHA